MTATKILTLHGEQRIEQLVTFARLADTDWSDIRIRAGTAGDFEIWALTGDAPVEDTPAALELVRDQPPAPPEPRPYEDAVTCECGAGPFKGDDGLKIHRQGGPHRTWQHHQDAQRAVASLEAPPLVPPDTDADRDEPDGAGGEYRCDTDGCGRVFSRPNGLNRHRNHAHPNKGTNSGPISTTGPRVGETRDDWERRLRKAAAAAI